LKTIRATLEQQRYTMSKDKSDTAPPPGQAAAAAATATEHPGHGERAPFPIVGIGASAGGLEAFEEFFRHLPDDCGLAFVLVPHLDPGHASLLTEILQRSTAMPVVEAENGVAVAANRVYIIPPNREMAIVHGQLCVAVPELPRGQRMPIDAFLRSLADDQGDQAIGVILSGTGSDGTLGMRAIHGAGGITLVQEPSSAKFPGMPGSVIHAAYATHVLPAADMPTVLLATARQLSNDVHPAPQANEATAVDIDAVLTLLHASTGHDFSHYKKGTIGRRIARRMLQHRLRSIDDYRAHVAAHPEEGRALFKDLLINVTRFFRDPEAFKVLKQEILPQLFADKPADYVFRIWVAGCASGEEAYSVAILVREFMSETQKAFKVQIYGTDLDEESIASARAGFYPPNIAADLTPAQLHTFFLHEDAGYRVRKEIREMLVFAVQNVIKDPPFSQLDLICCRNVMIYLEPELQNQLIRSLHYALRANGVLFLSPAETIGKHAELFTAVNRKWRFYRAIGATGPRRAMLRGDLSWQTANAGRAANQVAGKVAPTNLEELTRRALLQSFAPASVVTDTAGNIVFVHGDTARFLRPAPGQATLSVVDMALDSLRTELRAALHRAAEDGTTTSGRQVSAKIDGEIRNIRLSVHPLAEADGHQLLLVSFQEETLTATPTGHASTAAVDASSPAMRRIEELESELAHTWQALQSTIERQQVANEELMSSNEELQSTNEELQSTIEELETSKEELQSINEELVTVNGELLANSDHLTKTQNDLKNLLDNISGGIIFLDQQLCIRRFTSEAVDLYRLQAGDVGRPLADIKSTIEAHELLIDAQAVLDSKRPGEQEVRTIAGRHYQVRLKPYRTLDDDIDGVVMTFADITARVDANARVRTAQLFSESIVDTVREPLLVLDAELQVIAASRAFYQRFQVAKEETIGRQLSTLADRRWDLPAFRERLRNILPRDEAVENFPVEVDIHGGGRVKMMLNARRLAGTQPLILLTMEEVRSP
jgi:two-component system CheB/CheR fusion protein